MTSNIKVGPFRIIIDLIKLTDGWFHLLSFATFLVSIFICLKYGDRIQYDIIACLILDSIPTMLGFVVTCLTIIMGLNTKYLSRLSEIANDGEIPIMVIVASFVSCFVFLIITYLLSIFFKGIMIDCIGYKQLLDSLLFYCVLESALLLINVIFHLFATSTDLVEKK